MSAIHGSSKTATIADFLAIPEEERFHELIAGEIVEKASPSVEHGSAQIALGISLLGHFVRRPSGGGPAGWWFASEVEVRFGGDVCRPDVLGWRRDRLATRDATLLQSHRHPAWRLVNRVATAMNVDNG